ncbi:MAG TPA: PP2C family protein-serine/threonine phosphatase [Streptomyces sp.]|uniref:PP2C family protein-serine/threonine phosphatase n=1 Tax=Streptomyces sp. TaxID=1931 RepID=UPI002D5A486E|nr:PP2C family protein-serine/threonine phosphatase [Streptomyces sp.]HZG06479.1 PP2C family protein-serine/threonine phosphatase [Streptomyces sp.]
MTRERTPTPARRRWFSRLPAAVVLGAVVIDLLTPREVSTFPLLAAAPVVAAPVLSLAGTVATGVAAELTGALLTLVEGEVLFPSSAVVPFVSIAVLTVLAAVLNRVMARDRRQLKDAREVAEAVQRAVLPAPPERFGPLAVAVRYQAAAQEAAIGGDFYAIHPTPDGVRLVIADVRGKGLNAVRTVNSLLGTFHEAATRLPELPDVVRRMDERMREVNAAEGEAGTESFTTAVIAEIRDGGSVLRAANRGHPAPLLVHRGRVHPLAPGAPALPLGLGDLGGPQVPVDRYALPPGATLVLYTDGVVEARDDRGTFYDPVPALSRPLPADPDEVLDALLADLARHTGGRLDDDAALLAITRRPERAGIRPAGRTADGGRDGRHGGAA